VYIADTGTIDFKDFNINGLVYPEPGEVLEQQAVLLTSQKIGIEHLGGTAAVYVNDTTTRILKIQ
jgi:hypothetical protein